MDLKFWGKLVKKSGTESDNAQKATTLNRITAMIIATMSFSLVLSVFVAIVVFDKNFTRDTSNSVSHLSNGAIRIIEDWTDTLRTQSAMVATRPDVIAVLQGEDTNTSISQMIEDLTSQSDIDFLAILDENGTVIEDGGYNIDSGDNLSSLRAVENAMIDNTVLIFDSLASFDFAMSIAMPVKDEGENIIGAVLMGFDFTDDLYTNFIKDGFDVDCTIFKGDTVAETSLLDMNKGEQLHDKKIVDTVLYNGSYFVGKHKIGAQTFLCVYQPLMSEDGQTDGMIFVGKDLALIKKIAEKVLFVAIPLTAVLVALSVIVIVRAMNQMRSRESKVSETLFAETQNLVVASKENAATAQDQSAAVKEIVATMEDQNLLSENISQKVKDVASVANNTNENVLDGVKYLEANVAQLNEIAGANKDTITGIKLLGEKIENIWDIVTLINSVADQAKIIAFNAELEASSAGEAGKNFHIVATEIRRLADGIIDGTKEIKASINEIQQSSDSLILASESGTEKIQEGVENAKNLETRFTNIKNASEITAESANEITTIIQQQAMATEQILITLKQISAGVENFGAATENISNASQRLKELAEGLNK